MRCVLILLCTLCLSLPTLAQAPSKADFEKFVFFATLEGLYEMNIPEPSGSGPS